MGDANQALQWTSQYKLVLSLNLCELSLRSFTYKCRKISLNYSTKCSNHVLNI